MYYTGYTNDLERRINEHNNSCSRGAKYLKGKTPVKLVYVKEYNYYRNAVRAERDIKKRTKKEKEIMLRVYQKDIKDAPQVSPLSASKSIRGADNQKFFIKTFGCQMNDRDSEVICGLLNKEGYSIADEPDKADIILFNTCSVRQHAEDKVWSEIGKYKKGQSPPPRHRRGKGTVPLIGIVGCMAQNYKEKIFDRAPNVSFVVGPQDLHRIPEIIKKIGTVPQKRGQSLFFQSPRNGDSPFFSRKIWETDGSVRPEEIYHTGFYAGKEHAYVVISEGCSNFCSYCVVPYVRDALRNRNYKDILREIKEAVDKGITKITLLGQNVNAYLYEGVNFVKLVRLVDSIQGLKEFSFVTSHPKDTSSDLFRAWQELEKLKKYLHLPVQSGSDRILKLMHRGYTRKFYLDLVDNYRKIVKNGELTTDIIVGFPTEREEDFQDTYNLVNDIRFDAAYIFKYSTRPHTEAANFVDDITKEKKEKRHKVILDLQKEISKNKKC